MSHLKSFSSALLLSLCSGTLFAASDITLCQSCHGQDLQGQQALQAPKLTGLPSTYLATQLQNFKQGKRGSAPTDASGQQMQAISRNLSDENIEGIAQSIPTLPSEPVTATIEGDTKSGQGYYDGICGACHSTNGSGNVAMAAPPLAGQNDWYLLKQMNDFKAGHRGSHPEDKRGRQMQMMANTLPTPEAINNVLAYINSLGQ